MSNTDTTIYKEINQAIYECHRRTGDKPTKIYLGKTQMAQLISWAQENCCVSDDVSATPDGERRLKFAGLPVYEVNDECHCVVA